MNQLILASHGGLAEGARDTLSMVLGDVQNVHVVSLKRDDNDPITKEVGSAHRLVRPGGYGIRLHRHAGQQR